MEHRGSPYNAYKVAAIHKYSTTTIYSTTQLYCPSYQRNDLTLPADAPIVHKWPQPRGCRRRVAARHGATAATAAAASSKHHEKYVNHGGLMIPEMMMI